MRARTTGTGVPGANGLDTETGDAGRSLLLRRWRGGWGALAISLIARVTLGVIVSMTLVTLVPTAFGWQSTVVSSASMEPRLRVGDVVVAQPADAAHTGLGRIVLVRDPDHADRLRLHRYVDTTPAGLLVLRGDANAQNDSSPVKPSALLGIGTLRAPYLGLPAVWLGEGEFGAVAVAAGALLGLIGGSGAFRADGNGTRPGGGVRASARRSRKRAENAAPHAGRRPFFTSGRTRSTSGTQFHAATVLAAGCSITLAVTLMPALPASPAIAAFARTTVDAGNSWATVSRFGCADRVLADAPANYYKLAEPSGPTAADSSGNSRPGTYSSSGVSYGKTGPCSSDAAATAVTVDGGATSGITTANQVLAPTTFSTEIWFKTAVKTGGLLVGMYRTSTGVAEHDRVLFMDTTGQISFGMYSGGPYQVTTTAAGLNAFADGAWHLAVASYSAATGMRLSVDGVTTTKAVAFADNVYTGYWRVGFGNLGSTWGSNAPNTNGFNGTIASAAIYSKVLTDTQIANHLGSRHRTCVDTVTADIPSNYYRLNEVGGTVAADSSGNGRPGTYTTGVGYGTPGPCSTDAATAVTLNGAAATGITTANSVTAPTTFSTEIWFKTTTTAGGPLVGLFTDPTSGGVDRTMFMQNNGRIVAGMYDPANNRVLLATSPIAYNNGAWHLVTMTYSTTAGTTLYLDGSSVATNTTIPSSNGYTGYWRAGYGYLNGWGDRPGVSAGFAGSVSGFAVYPTALTSAQVVTHYAAR